MHNNRRDNHRATTKFVNIPKPKPKPKPNSDTIPASMSSAACIGTPRMYSELKNGPAKDRTLPYAELVTDLHSMTASPGPFRQFKIGSTGDAMDDNLMLFSSLVDVIGAQLRRVFRTFNCDSAALLAYTSTNTDNDNDSDADADAEIINVPGSDTVEIRIDDASSDYTLTSTCVPLALVGLSTLQDPFLQLVYQQNNMSQFAHTAFEDIAIAVYGLTEKFALVESLELVTGLHLLLRIQLAAAATKFAASSPNTINTVVYTHPCIFKYLNLDITLVVVRIWAIFTDTPRDTEITTFGLGCNLIVAPIDVAPLPVSTRRQSSDIDEPIDTRVSNIQDVFKTAEDDECNTNRYVTVSVVNKSFVQRMRDKLGSLRAPATVDSSQVRHAPSYASAVVGDSPMSITNRRAVIPRDGATKSALLGHSSGSMGPEPGHGYENDGNNNDIESCDNDNNGDDDDGLPHATRTLVTWGPMDKNKNSIDTTNKKPNWWRKSISWQRLKQTGRAAVKTLVELGKISSTM